MNPPRTTHLVVHSHFYQPPREDPWLELVPREATALPFHDWNQRITSECYRPLALGQLLDGNGRVRGLVNTYAWCSFDVGPTLFHWFDTHAPDVRDAIVAGDRASIARLGAGNAMAMPYHHLILPLISRRDKVTEVRWGIRDFRARFGREPQGMWLPETAVDEETLAVLADERIAFTVLAPSQVNGAPPFGRPGRWRGAGGRTVAIFAYDGAAAHHVAFGDSLNNATRWEAALLASPAAPDGTTIVSLATDGETFGHHHKFGNLALAALIDGVAHRGDAALTNFAAVLAAHPPEHDVTIVSPSSWSCPHGVERWKREDGCRFEAGTSQAWRAPLRQGLEALSGGITDAVRRLWPAVAGDLYTARDVAGADLAGVSQLPATARRLLDVERHALAMFTSCAWFFDDIARLEPKIVLRHAARALDLLPIAERARLERALVATLGEARSNDTTKGTGADIWQADVLPYADGVARLVAGVAALRELSPDSLGDAVMPAHRWQLDGDEIVVEHKRTGESSRWRATPTTHGVVAASVRVISVPDEIEIGISAEDFPEPLRDTLREIAAPMVFDAALSPPHAALLAAGLLEPAAARAIAMADAWALLDRDGVDTAGVVMHGVLDLYALDARRPDDSERATAFTRLSALPDSPARASLAQRFGVA